MKQWISRALLLGVVAVLVYFSYRFFFPSAESVIRKRLNEMAQLASFGPNEGPLAKMMNAEKLVSFFTSEPQVLVDVPGHSMQTLEGQDAIRGAAMTARNHLTGLTVEFPDVRVEVAPDKQGATAEVTLHGRIAGERDQFEQELKIAFVKVGRDWLIQKIETVRTLR